MADSLGAPYSEGAQHVKVGTKQQKGMYKRKMAGVLSRWLGAWLCIGVESFVQNLWAAQSRWPHGGNRCNSWKGPFLIFLTLTLFNSLKTSRKLWICSFGIFKKYYQIVKKEIVKQILDFCREHVLWSLKCFCHLLQPESALYGAR